MRRFGLRGDQWERIRHLLPGREGSVGVTAADNRLFVEAVLYRYRTGMPWRDLPERFGDWKNVHRRFSRWAKSGVWEGVFHYRAADADNEYAMIDSTDVRAHQHSAGVQKSRRGPGDRTFSRRGEGQDPCSGRRAGPTAHLSTYRRRATRPGRGGPSAAHDGGRYADRRQGVRRRRTRPAAAGGRWQDRSDPAANQPILATRL